MSKLINTTDTILKENAILNENGDFETAAYPRLDTTRNRELESSLPYRVNFFGSTVKERVEEPSIKKEVVTNVTAIDWTAIDSQLEELGKEPVKSKSDKAKAKELAKEGLAVAVELIEETKKK